LNEQADFLRELSSYYIQTRYPEEIADMGREVKEGIAREILIKMGNGGSDHDRGLNSQ